MTFKEELAKLEHEQWQYWTKTMIERFEKWKNEADEIKDIDDMIHFYEDKLYLQSQTWKENHKDYEELPENIKDFDRAYVDKTIAVFTKLMDEKKKQMSEEKQTSELTPFVGLGYLRALMDLKDELEK